MGSTSRPPSFWLFLKRGPTGMVTSTGSFFVAWVGFWVNLKYILIKIISFSTVSNWLHENIDVKAHWNLGKVHISFSTSCSCLTPSENNWILENEIHKSNSTIISHFKWNTYSVYVKGQMYNNHQTIILAHFSDNLWSNHMMVLVKNVVENY